ncbi:unnamed protein product, partial [Ectocarpus sp. 4 AP-2014]
CCARGFCCYSGGGCRCLRLRALLAVHLIEPATFGALLWSRCVRSKVRSVPKRLRAVLVDVRHIQTFSNSLRFHTVLDRRSFFRRPLEYLRQIHGIESLAFS